jgi:TolB protein
MRIATLLLVALLGRAGGKDGSLHPSWSPDGLRVAFQSDHDGDHEIYVVSAEGGDLLQLTHNDSEDAMPTWTADGRHVRYMAVTGGEHVQLEVPFGGAAPRRVEGPPTPPAVKSRDGRLLAWEASVAGPAHAHGGPTAIFLRPSAGGAARRVSGPGHSEQPSFSPDGQLLVYENRQPEDELIDSRLFVVPTSGGSPRLLTKGTDPSWSPDGRLILFKAWVPDRKQLVVSTIAPDGSGLRHLETGVHPSWSPDGSRILYMSEAPGGTWEISTMSASGASRRCLSCRSR